MRSALTFALLWLATGFVTGTATLLGPVRFITNHGRGLGWSEAAESLAVRGVMVAFVIGSCGAALWLTRIVTRTPHRHVRLALHALASIAAIATVSLWLDPATMNAGGSTERAGTRFTFGPYPDEQRLRQLADEGYTSVVSLLHPAVVPFETKLIRDGEAAVHAAGLEFVHVPMLPWVSDNTAALARIAEIARATTGRYYVHCYLGKDRIRLAKRQVEELLGPDSVAATNSLEEHVAARNLGEETQLARGEVVLVDPGVWLAPYPTDDEFMSWVLPGSHGPVVSLLDPDLASDRPWVDKERALLTSNGVGFTLLPIDIEPYDAELAREVARQVAAMPRPVFVHAFLSAGSGKSPAAEAFLQAFRSDLPPLPPALFATPLEAGPTRVVAPHVAIGPEPTRRDCETLRARGVRALVRLEDDARGEPEEQALCTALGPTSRACAGDAAGLVQLLRAGGPWYVYGAGIDAAGDIVAANLGPAIPPSAEPTVVNHTASEEAQDAPSASGAALPTLARRFVPDFRTAVLLGPILLLTAGAAAAGVGWLSANRSVRAPYTRKLFHFVIFTTAGVLHLTAGLPGVMLFGSIVSALVLYAVWRGEGFPFYEALARPSDAPRRTLFVLVPLVTTAVGGLGANVLFGAWAQVGYLVAGWGDAIAEPVGTRWGRHRYRVPSLAGVAATRSIEGSLAVCLVGGLAALAGLVLAGVDPLVATGVALACGLAGATVEAVSNHGLDNLTVQLAASGTAFLLLS